MIIVKLREAIAAHHLRTGEQVTYEALAQRTGLSRATLESIASRPSYNATLSTIAAICRALGCQPGDILELLPDETDEH